MMFEPSGELRNALRNLGRCLVAMGDYRDQSVLAGGLATVIYRYLNAGTPIEQPPLTTFDSDIGLCCPLHAGSGDSLNRLMRGAGFDLYTVGVGESEAHYYVHRDEGPKGFSPIHVEFLSPLPDTGKAVRSNCRSLELQPDLVVQALSYFELLFYEPLKVRASQVPALEIPLDIMFRVANPAVYVVQKALIRVDRSELKRDKDLAYIYYVTLLHRREWANMKNTLQRAARKERRYREWIQRALDDLGVLFESESADGPVGVVSEYGGEGFGPIADATVVRVMKQFLREVSLSNGE